MNLPTDAAIARAFWELHEMQMDGFVDADAVIMMAEQFDDAKLTTSPERVQIPAESEHDRCAVMSQADTSARNASAGSSTRKAGEMTGVAPYDRCPKCTAHMPVGKTCGGMNCGLRGKE